MKANSRALRIASGLLAGIGVYFVVSVLFLDRDASREPLESEHESLPARRAPTLGGAHSVNGEQPPRTLSELTVRVVVADGRPLDEQQAYLIRPTDLASPASGAVLAWAKHALRVSRGELKERVLIVTARGAVPVQATWDELSASSVSGVAILELPVGVAVSGVVEDPWGRPIPGAQVRALGRHGHDVELLRERSEVPGPGWVCDLAETESDAQGRFELSGLAALPVDLFAHKAHFIRDLQHAPLRVSESESAGVRLVLQPLLRFGVLLLDATTGDPILASSLGFKFPRGVSVSPQPLAYAAVRQHGDGVQSKSGTVWTTLRATVAFDGDPRQGFDLTVVARAPYYEPMEATIRVSPNGGAALKTLRLQRAVPFARLVPLRVSVRSRVGLAKQAVILKLSPTDRRSGGPFMARATLDEQGRASLPLPPGEYGVEIIPVAAGPWWKSRGSAHALVTLDEHDGGELSVDLAGGVAEIIVGAQTPPFYDVALFRKRRGRYAPHYYSSSLVMRVGESMRDYHTAYPLRSDRFLLPLRPGKYMVVVSPRGQPPLQGEFELLEGTRIQVRLEPAEGK